MSQPSQPAGQSGMPSLELARLPERGLGIRVKLVALMVGMTLIIIVPLSSYFAAREMRELNGRLRGRAEMYALLAGQQLRSAVAFDDRETAREVLTAIARDRFVDGIAVYGAEGDELYAEGERSELARRAKLLTRESRTFQLPGRILVTAPVMTLEGVRGNVVLELSTRSVREMQRRLALAATATGAVALLLGTAIAWLIARSLSRRIEAIAAAASAMSAGELERRIDPGRSNDEIGLLAHGFNAMSRKVSELVKHIQVRAREESERLERLVARRTEQLERKNEDLRLVLDNVEQGFVTLNRHARVVGEYSRVLEEWLGPLGSERTSWDLLSEGAPVQRLAFELAWEQVTDDVMPLDVALGQLPSRLRRGERELSLEYRALSHEGRVLVVITDVTASRAREASEQVTRDLIHLASRLFRNPEEFAEFFDDCERLLRDITDNRSDALRLKRDVHTLKGTSLSTVYLGWPWLATSSRRSSSGDARTPPTALVCSPAGLTAPRWRSACAAAATSVRWR